MWNIDSFSIFNLKYFPFFVTYDTNEECLGFELLIRQKKAVWMLWNISTVLTTFRFRNQFGKKSEVAALIQTVASDKTHTHICF